MTARLSFISEKNAVIDRAYSFVSPQVFALMAWRSEGNLYSNLVRIRNRSEVPDSRAEMHRADREIKDCSEFFVPLLLQVMHQEIRQDGETR